MKSMETVLDRFIENRHGEPCEQKVGNDLKLLTVEVCKATSRQCRHPI